MFVVSMPISMSSQPNYTTEPRLVPSIQTSPITRPDGTSPPTQLHQIGQPRGAVWPKGDHGSETPIGSNRWAFLPDSVQTSEMYERAGFVKTGVTPAFTFEIRH